MPVRFGPDKYQAKTDFHHLEMKYCFPGHIGRIEIPHSLSGCLWLSVAKQTLDEEVNPEAREGDENDCSHWGTDGAACVCIRLDRGSGYG